MTDYSLEIAALLRGIEVLWKRAGKVMPSGLWAVPSLTETDQLRLQVANRLAGGIAPDNSPTALTTIFGQIEGGSTGFLPVQKRSVLSPTEPQKDPPNPASLKVTYGQLCSDLEVEASRLRQLHGQSSNLYLEGVYYLLESFTSNIPVSTQMSDISLLDYNHTVAALCSALRSKDDDYIRALHGDKNGGQDDRQIGVLISGDIAGVQDFIYSLTQADQAAKQLRGRSFYLQALTEAVQRYLLRQLDLPISSVIYSGGAHFYILAPSVALEELDALRQQVTQGLLAFHQRDLYLVIGSATVAVKDLQLGKISARWSALHGDLATRKRQRYAELIDAEGADFYGQVFSPIPQHQANPLERFFERVGRSIPYATYLSFGMGAPINMPENALEALGVSLALDAPNWQMEMPADIDYVVRYAIRDGTHQVPIQSNKALLDGTRYMINLVPTSKDGEPSSFDDLAEIPAFMDAKGAPHGIKRLGILRMDVDNLGMIFKEGFGDRATLARITTLSRTLATFFEGRIGEICRQVENDYGQPAIYSVYAGGDDVFLVGPWHLMPRLASEIRKEFRGLTQNHPKLTISGGIALVAEKFPLYQAAEVAHDALDKAKGRTGKNALCFLEEILVWETAADALAFKEVEKWAQKFIKVGREHGRDFPMGILGRLMEFEEQRRKSAKDGGSAQWGRWIWQGIYQFHRLREQYDDRRNPEIFQLIKEVLEALQQKKFTSLPTLAVAARWAHLTLRRTSAED